jgi:hypothetical protein
MTFWGPDGSRSRRPKESAFVTYRQKLLGMMRGAAMSQITLRGGCDGSEPSCVNSRNGARRSTTTKALQYVSANRLSTGTKSRWAWPV